jgi:hypothetical protein
MPIDNLHLPVNRRRRRQYVAPGERRAGFRSVTTGL